MAYAALGAAIAGDIATASDLVADLTSDSDPTRLYGVHSGIADAAAHLLAKVYGDRAPDLHAGGRWSVQQLGLSSIADPLHVAYSVRFTVAYANGDKAACLALYQGAAELGGEHLARCTAQLITDVAGLGRTALERLPG